MQPTVSAPTITQVKELIDYRLNEYCAVRIRSAATIGEQYETLWKTVQTLIQAGGKRFRPYMLITAFSAYSDEDADVEAILPAALAQELIHQAVLIHDDIIDRDTMRYGIQNVAGQYDAIYKPDIKSASERSHMTMSSALLAGDALLSDAYHFLSRVKASPEQLSQATSILSQGVFEVIGGELLDTESSFLAPGTISAETVGRFKTASYSFISPITMGAVLAGAPQTEIQMLRQLSEYLGIGYQLRDDLLGVFGDSTQTGKSTSSDIIEGKRTYLIEQFELLADEQQKQAFASIFHNNQASESDVETARQLLIQSGALKKAEEAIELLETKAHAVVNLLSIADESKAVLADLIQHCLSREK
jgi:geranylgeranyl diphosphate synthase, type II